eukprot:7258419-Prorocentrum_lima.AAC.1
MAQALLSSASTRTAMEKTTRSTWAVRQLCWTCDFGKVLEAASGHGPIAPLTLAWHLAVPRLGVMGCMGPESVSLLLSDLSSHRGDV